MATADLTNGNKKVITGKDNIVIVDILQSVRGGRTLDVTGYSKPIINAGHVIILDSVTGEYKPMPIKSDGSGYDALPTDNTYVGVLINTIETKNLSQVFS